MTQKNIEQKIDKVELPTRKEEYKYKHLFSLLEGIAYKDKNSISDEINRFSLQGEEHIHFVYQLIVEGLEHLYALPDMRGTLPSWHCIQEEGNPLPRNMEVIMGLYKHLQKTFKQEPSLEEYKEEQIDHYVMNVHWTYERASDNQTWGFAVAKDEMEYRGTPYPEDSWFYAWYLGNR